MGKQRTGGDARALAILSFAASMVAATAAAQDGMAFPRYADRLPDVLRVCADPNNMPFSNRAGEGFENAIAELLAEAVGLELEYYWQPQRRGFIREALYSGDCDVIIGTPHVEIVDTTRTYYRSSYVFVSREDNALDFSSINAEELETLRIGVHLIGDDGSNVPPAHALGQRGIVDNITGYMIYGDYREAAPPTRVLDAVVDGEIDIAAVWGPLAGPYVKSADVPLRMIPITDTIDYLPLMFEYAIGMGVRDGDDALRSELNQFVMDHADDIAVILTDYGVPTF